MAEVFDVSGSVDSTPLFRSFYEARGVDVSTQMASRSDAVPSARTGARNAVIAPLRNLISVRLDPTWYAEFSHLWPVEDRLDVTFLRNFEEGFTESAQANYTSTEVIGRAESYKTYTGTSNRTVPITFQFVAQGINGVNLRDTINKEVVAPARWLDGLNQPIEYNGVSYPPPPVFLTLGQLLVMRCIATDITVKWGETCDPATLLPLRAEVDVTFVAVTPRIGNYNFTGPTRSQSQPLSDGFGAYNDQRAN